MKVACAWCGKTMSEGPDDDNKPISHGICAECTEKVMSEFTGGKHELERTAGSDIPMV
jgi:hypothetical protein